MIFSQGFLSIILATVALGSRSGVQASNELLRSDPHALRELGGNNKDDLPNGKPFQNLQDQIDILEMNLEDLELQFEEQLDEVDATLLELEARIQANADDIEALNEYQDVQDAKISLLEGQTFSLEERMTAVEEDLDEWEDTFEAFVASLESLLEAFDERLVVLEGRVDDNVDDITAIYLADQAMQAQIATLEGAISTLANDIVRLEQLDGGVLATAEALIAGLQSQVDAVRANLSSKQNRITGSCPVGYSIRVIYSSGAVTCEKDDSSNTFQVVDFWSCRNFSSAGYWYHQYFCPSGLGYLAVSGGYYVSSNSFDVYEGKKVPRANGWRVRAYKFHNTFSRRTMCVQVNCLRSF
mmetsp:Transcript_4649/g.8617  ORF Transcript_4649/g.8617 Transcript_4649/m.8617 type:complete len:355 (-) Transcript_4649:165-1229(-)